VVKKNHKMQKITIPALKKSIDKDDHVCVQLTFRQYLDIFKYVGFISQIPIIFKIYERTALCSSVQRSKPIGEIKTDQH
jgi:hypothetical protein